MLNYFRVKSILNTLQFRLQRLEHTFLSQFLLVNIISHTFNGNLILETDFSVLGKRVYVSTLVKLISHSLEQAAKPVVFWNPIFGKRVLHLGKLWKGSPSFLSFPRCYFGAADTITSCQTRRDNQTPNIWSVHQMESTHNTPRRVLM